jgi:hypothetical protein
VAALDIDYGAGKLTEDEWTTRRSELKERLAASKVPAP